MLMMMLMTLLLLPQNSINRVEATVKIIAANIVSATTKAPVLVDGIACTAAFMNTVIVAGISVVIVNAVAAIAVHIICIAIITTTTINCGVSKSIVIISPACIFVFPYIKDDIFNICRSR